MKNALQCIKYKNIYKTCDISTVSHGHHQAKDKNKLKGFILKENQILRKEFYLIYASKDYNHLRNDLAI